MKSLQESLFDDNLVSKSVDIDIEQLKEMLFDFGYKIFKKNDNIDYHEGKSSIYIRKNFYEYNLQLELDFGVINYYNDDHEIEPGFNMPSLIVRMNHYSSTPEWKASRADYNATIRQINKKIPSVIKGLYHTSVVPATSEGISETFKLYDGMVKHFCSEKFQKHVFSYAERFKDKGEIPGLIVDILMKELINNA